MINKLAIIGIGLIGGSLARALRRAGYVREIVGYGRNLNNVKQAVESGVIDRAEVSLTTVVADADMVVVAVPVGAMAEIFARINGAVGRETVITDVGSVKVPVISAAREALAEHFTRFVPGHPIAGTERSGVAASREDLFFDHRIILSPEAETSEAALESVRAMWEAAGGQVRLMPAERHDIVLAACSHLPHMLAYTLVEMLVRRDEHREIFDCAAGGFRDFTRIAGSDPVMWRDICLANRDALLALMADYQKDLSALMTAVKKGDGQLLLETFERAHHAREAYVRQPVNPKTDEKE